MDIDYEVEKIFSVYKSIDTNKKDKGYLHEKRLKLDQFIFDSLKSLYGNHFKEFWNKVVIPKKSEKALVVVERTCNINLEFILHNASYYARGYTIHIFCSEANLPFIQHICRSQPNIYIHTIFRNIGTPEEGKLEYNALLKTKDFWNTFEEEHIITLETDCYLVTYIPDSIYEYDYVASQWGWLPNEPGGGGLSYRKCSVMKEICNMNNIDINCMQDIFASDGVKKLNLKYSHSYFTESTFLNDYIGTHQWWTFLPVDDPECKDIIKYYLLLDCETFQTGLMV
jgi:hypothetical protein